MSRRNWIIIIIVAVLVVGLLIYFGAPTGPVIPEKYNKESKRIYHTLPIYHGVNTGCFPSLIPPINEKTAHVEFQQKLIAESNKCGQCEVMEKQLVEDAKKYLVYATCVAEKGKQCIPYSVNWSKYDKYKGKGCTVCDYFLRGWKDWFEAVKRISTYFATGKLPEEPEIIQTDCEQCMKNQNNIKKHGNVVLANAKCEMDGKEKCPNLDDLDFIIEFKCQQCEPIHRNWMLYVGTMLEIRNYIRCKKGTL
jgi:hypothetical protein